MTFWVNQKEYLLLSVTILLILVKPATCLEKDCQSFVTGYYHCSEIWNRPAPALLSHETGKHRIIYGEIIEKMEKGVKFRSFEKQMFGSQKPKYFQET